MLQERLGTQEKELGDLRQALKKAETELEHMRSEESLKQASTDMVQKHIAEQEQQLETARKDVLRLKKELQSALQQRQELHNEVQSLGAKLMAKEARDCMEEERESAKLEELAEERARNSSLVSRVKELEQVYYEHKLTII